MPVRFPFASVILTPASVPGLYQYWGGNGYSRPQFSVLLYNPSQDLFVHVNRVRLDTGSDWTVFPSHVAQALGLALPQPRTVHIGTASGQTSFTLPDDGGIGLLVTDYREYYYLSSSPIGFWHTAAGPSILGVTGFLQYFEMMIHNDGVHRPEIELRHTTTFPGRHGLFSATGSFKDFLRNVSSGA